MKKLLLLCSIVSIAACSTDPDPWYEYVPVGQDDPIDEYWFSSMYSGLKNSYSEIERSKEELNDKIKTWSLAVPWVLKLSIDYDLCLNNTNSYNYEAINFDDAQFNLWGLPKYIEFNKCY